MEQKEQPNIQFQRKLQEIISATPSEVEVCGKKRTIHWIRNYAEKKWTNEMLKEPKSDSYELKKRNTRALAYILLMRRFKIVFFHWFYWRWLFYVKEISPVEMLGILDAVKKKMTTEPSLLCTTLLIGMMDTTMAMTEEEARLTQAEQVGGQPTV
ncbi:MAG: hypothetical protein J5510_08630 [Prevotella sp.]|nr:hypothetical protein [Prevotella sp.]